MINRKELIRQRIEDDYGHQQWVPHGADSRLAEEYGVSRELVRQARSATGFPIKSQPAISEPKYVCACGIERSSLTLCTSCKHITLPCNYCGESVTRLASRFVSQIKRGRYFGFVYCNRKCFGAWLGTNFGFKKGNKWNSTPSMGATSEQS